MSEAVLYLPNINSLSRAEKQEVRSAIATERQKIVESMEAKVDYFKIQLIREALNQKGLRYDETITTYYDFRKYIMDSKEYSKEDKKELIDACVYIDENVNGLLQELINGSTSSIERFLKEMYQKIGKPVAKGVIGGLAVSSLVQMAPTVEAKLAVIAASLGVSTYKLIRGLKDKAYAKSNAACNEALRELETTKKDGKIVDTRFPENVIKEIKEYLVSNNIPFEDTGYLSLRETIYGLEYEKKLELVRKIQNEMGKETGINEKVAKYNENFSTFVNNSIIKPISQGVSAAIPIATIINQIEPALLSGPFNAFVTRLFTAGKMSEFLSWTATASSGAISFFGKHIPVLGKYITGLLAGENIILVAMVGGAIGLTYNIGKSLLKTISSKIEGIKTAREAREFRKVELELYKDSIQEEIEKIESILNEKGKDSSREFIIDLVCSYFEKKDKPLTERPKTVDQLEQVINTLDKEDKRELASVLKEVLKYSEKHPKTFKETLQDIAGTTMTLLGCGLASLNLIDILTGKGILKSISNSDFLKGIPGHRMTEIPTIEGGEALKQKAESKLPQTEADTGAFVRTQTEVTVTPGPSRPPTADPTTIAQTPAPEVPVAPIDSYGGHHPGTLTTYLAEANPDPAEFFKMFHKDFSGGTFIDFAELDREKAEKFLHYFQEMEVTAENKKDFEILTNALLGRIDQINEAIIAHNTKIATLNKVYNGAVVGSVLAETYNGVSKPDSEKSNNAIYTGVAKVR